MQWSKNSSCSIVHAQDMKESYLEFYNENTRGLHAKCNIRRVCRIAKELVRV